MAYTDVLNTGAGEFSFGFAEQSSGLNTAATTGWVWLDALFPSISWEVREAEEAKSSGQRGARARKSVGTKVGTLAFRCEMPGQPLDFDASSGNPTAAGAWALVAAALGGSAVGDYLASGVVAASSDAGTIELASGTHKLGCAYGYGPAIDDIEAIGWVQSVDGTTITLRHDMRVEVSDNANVYPLLTMYESAAQPDPYTFRLTGDLATHDYRWIGCIPSQMSFSWDSADRLWCDFEFRVYGGEVEAAAGGLQAIIGRNQIDEFAGRGRAQFLLAATQLGLTDGEADSGVCGTMGHTFSIAWPHTVTPCQSQTENVGAVRIRGCTMTFDCSVQASPEWDDANDAFLFKAAHQEQSDIDLSLNIGSASGQMFAMSVPAGLMNARPQGQDSDGTWTYSVSITPGANWADGGATDAGNKPFALAIG